MFSPTLVHEYLTRSAGLYPGKEAVVCGEDRWTYREVEARSCRLAEHLLEQGLARQDRVVIFMENSSEAVISIYGILRAGGVFVMLSAELKPRKLRYVLRDSGASVIIAQRKKSGVVKEAIEGLETPPRIVWVHETATDGTSFDDATESWEEIFRGFDAKLYPVSGEKAWNRGPRLIDYDLSTLVYTSGSTGEPKGVMSSHFNMVSAARSIIQYLGNTPNDRVIMALPLSFDYGLYQVIMAFMYGGTVILEKNIMYPVRFLETIECEKVTGFPLVPTIAAFLLKLGNLSEYDMSSLRYITNTGARLPVEHIRKIRVLFPDVRVFSMFGLTECKRVSFLPPEEIDRRPGSVGIPIPNCEVFVMDGEGKEVQGGEVGELVVRGANVMQGYWNAPELTAKVYRQGVYPGEKFLWTGDYFRKDEDGFLFFLGRKDDMIKTKGERVFPKEIENVLCQCEGVADAAVIGIPDEFMGQAIKAFIAPSPGMEITERAILRYCSENMEPLMVPKAVEFMKELPTSPNGKIDKKVLRDRASKGIQRRTTRATNSQEMLLDGILLNTVERYSDNIAAVHGDMRMSYGALLDEAAKVATVLRERGVQRGERMLIALENSFAYMISYYGVLLAGGVTVSVNPDIKRERLAKIAADCAASGLITNSDALPQYALEKSADSFRFILAHGRGDFDEPSGAEVVRLDEIRGQSGLHVRPLDRSPEELASIIYTSGTTGEPKGVMLSHRNLVSNSRSIVEYLRLTDRDSVMVVLPFYYVYGNSLLMTHVMQGGRLVLDNRFIYPNKVLDSMTKEEVTGFAGVPSTFAILLNRSKFRSMPIPSLRYITQAGGPMPHDMAMEIARIHPQANLFIMYGMTEGSARLSYLPPEDLSRKFGSVGKGIPGVTLEVLNENGEEVRPGEIGEVVAKGDNIMTGYWGKEEETVKVLRSGKLFTGDMATVDEEGYIYIRGRRTDMIKSGAHRIAPREIEEVLLKHPKVEAAVVVGQQDPILGEAICAFLMNKEGETCEVKEILKLCHENLPGYMVPKKIQFVTFFPLTQSGKIKREEFKKIIISESIL